jgi:BMFP domain-containing protein YqiC
MRYAENWNEGSMSDGNDRLAEMIEWQARCSDAQNSIERLREERDALLSTIVSMRQKEDALVTRVTELEAIVQRMSQEIARHRADGEMYP